ncbi:DUF998 domain-containing protein [Thermococcus sp.]|uniref:DUF998 domain-containing protein n=1 Tax=Thermococcus sp. TaxID=35749 RepID=UPI00260E68C9|nr:DUF998 domain-containing protein [Thermococcus sp.]
MRKSQLYAGILAPIVALSGIGVGVFLNRSWWQLTENAISDLGRLGLRYNWVLNVSLVISAVLAIYYAIGLLGEVRSLIEKAGIVIFIVGLGFLALIGIFPEGTSTHYYVSWGFFVFSSLGLLIAGIGMGLSGEKGLAVFTVALFITGWVLATWARNHFAGVAPAEFVGVFGIVAWHYTLIWKRFTKVLRPRG